MWILRTTSIQVTETKQFTCVIFVLYKSVQFLIIYCHVLFTEMPRNGVVAQPQQLSIFGTSYDFNYVQY